MQVRIFEESTLQPDGTKLAGETYDEVVNRVRAFYSPSIVREMDPVTV